MIYTHKRTGNRYLVTDTDVRLKHPDTGLWVAAVEYRALGGVSIPPAKYVRTLADFEAKFEMGEVDADST